MKQKQVKQTPKNAKQAKPAKKETPSKKVEEAPVEDEDVAEEEIVEVKKPVNKKNAKAVAPVVPKEEDAEDEAAGNEDDEEQGDDDDDAPSETAIDKQGPTIPSKVKGGEIPDTVPLTRIVHVNKLPKKCKQVDIVEVFAKYGPIEQIHIVTSPAATVANVAFKTEKAATAALAAHKTVQVNGSTIEVVLKSEWHKKEKYDVNESRDRTVYVKYLKHGTTEEQIQAHFESCGEIERIKLVERNSVAFAFVTFTDKAVVESAKKLHNSVLNDTTIGVYENSVNSNGQLGNRDEKLTIILKNTKQNFDKMEGSKLESIFADCGEIASMDVLCKKNTLAFITFKTEDAVEKAFKLNGETVQDVELEIEHYNAEKKKTSIYIANVSKDATEEDLQTLFAKAGEISALILRKGFAIIHFKDSEAYCKSFMLDESYVKGQMVFIEPHSMRKQTVMKNKHRQQMRHPFKKNDNKRSAGSENGNSVFTPKKAKII